MAITFVGVASTPADNGSQAGPTNVVDKDAGTLASAAAGDLILVLLQYRNNNGENLNPGNDYSTGGQVWSVARSARNTNVTLVVAWCTFNGTWTADPSFVEAGGGTLALTAVALVFRPSAAGKIWQPNIWPKVGTFTAGSSPFTKTITAVTTATLFSSNSHVAIAAWASADDNTWGSLAGTGWSQTSLSAQYRNLTGSDQSLAVAYQIQSSSGTTNNVSLNQATLGGDAGATLIMAFTEVDEPSGGGGGSTGVVQSAIQSENSGGTTCVGTLGGAVASGNGVGGFFHWENASNAGITSIADNQGNRYYIAQAVCHQFLDQAACSFYRPNITNGPTTVTATTTATEIWRGIAIAESDKLYKLDKLAGRLWISGDVFNPEIASSPAVTPGQNGSLFLGWINNCDASQDEPPWFTTQSPWTRLQGAGSQGGGVNAHALYSYGQTTAGAQAFSAQQLLGRDANLMQLAFVPAAPGGGGTTRGAPFNIGTAFNGGRTFSGPLN